MTGLVLSLGVAIAQFWPNYGSILIVLGIFLVGQFVEGNVLSPKLVGESVGLHPVWLIFALLAFGYLFGFVGLLVAVPLAATIGVLCRFALRRYLQSSFYTGEEIELSDMDSSLAPRQLVLALDHSVSFAPEDFLQGPSNAAALTLIERWPDWPDRIVAMIGPEGSGKSHLASIWADVTGARILSAKLLPVTDLPAAFVTGALVLEDLEFAGLDERALFHFLNLAREQRAFVLITSRSPLSTFPVAIRDLASRIRVLPSVTLTSPDDTLLRALMVKLAADRQIVLDETLVNYLANRIERSFAAARAAVHRLDEEAMRQHRPVTRALAAELFRTP